MSIDRASRPALRLALGLALAIVVAYGAGWTAPHVSVLVAVMLLAKPGAPIPFVKGCVLGGALFVLTGVGVWITPLLEHYAAAAMLLIALVLFLLFYLSQRSANPLLTLMVVGFTMIPVAGSQEQALAVAVILALARGVVLGVVVGLIAHALWGDEAVPGKTTKPESKTASRWQALRGVVIIMPVLVLALSNPSQYMAAIMKTSALGQQASALNARNAGRELLGSTLLGAGVASLVWVGLSLWPVLWMYALWMALAGLWLAMRLYRLRPVQHPPSYWMNALITLVIFVGPAVEDSANGKDVMQAALIRLALFVGVSLYAWAAIVVLEWLAKRVRQDRVVDAA
ncbi:DUF2955 domain-containing protein [Jeongeupia wiesaeckerbachi]|uniref:DUF2955 domain-containing protein n=1 Tax=Jeongeupia wiesaeckerbachi TaxID=3051218 RepID=UPI003D8044A2